MGKANNSVKRKILVVACSVVAAIAIGFGIGFYVNEVKEEKLLREAKTLFEEGKYDEFVDIMLKLDDERIQQNEDLLEKLSAVYYTDNLQRNPIYTWNCEEMEIAPDGKTIAVSDLKESTVKIFSYPDLKELQEIRIPGFERIFGLAFSPSGDKIALAISNHDIKLIDTDTGVEVQILEGDGYNGEVVGHAGTTRDVVFVDDHTLVSCGNDRKVICWDLHSGNIKWAVRAANKNIKGINVSHDGRWVVTASNDGTASIISVATGKIEKTFEHGANYVNDAIFTPDAKHVITIGGDRLVKIWNVETGIAEKTIETGIPLASVDVSADGKTIMVSGTHLVYAIDAASGKIITHMAGPGSAVWSIKFHPTNGKYLFIDYGSLYEGKLIPSEEMLRNLRQSYK